MFLLLPETSTPNILLGRAQRLRKLTGDNRLMAQSEIEQKNLNPCAVIIDALIKPLEITIKDPAIAFVKVYTAIIYGIYYSFFEVFREPAPRRGSSRFRESNSIESVKIMLTQLLSPTNKIKLRVS